MIGFDRADLPVLGAIFALALGLTVLVIYAAALFGIAGHVFTWAYTGVW